MLTRPSDATATARLDIDLSALLHNYQTLRQRAGTAEVAPVVKADGYGLGAGPIAGHLARNGARTFFVARLSEGVDLRKALGAGPVIYVLDGLSDPSVFSAHDLRPVINTAEQYQRWISAPDTLAAALHIDTGMNRLGVRAGDLDALPARGRRPLTLVMSHLVCGDEPNSPINPQQLTAFRQIIERFPGVPRSLANSGGHFLGPDYAFDLTRPGISLYGGGPFGKTVPDIRQVATLKAQVLQVGPIDAGETVGYGASFKARNPMWIATLGIGYADGLMRSFGAYGFATVNGERRHLAGRISMDLCCLDVTDLDVAVGDLVEILGPAQPVDEVAHASSTISYEILTRIAPRVERHYI
ncbi:alanine racemase [Asticcacaulis solisilvae]|uniref:alanine racemase n=1 Tax=Asticcacaulis solisilvae TaxID=1217274 RepID=UPI003FD6EDAA